MAACEASLKRLRTDYLDLYQVHWPQRPTNFFGKLGFDASGGDGGVPIAEPLSALAELQQQGKIRHRGVSNETPWGVGEYLRLHREQQSTEARPVGRECVSTRSYRWLPSH